MSDSISNYKVPLSGRTPKKRSPAKKIDKDLSEEEQVEKLKEKYDINTGRNRESEEGMEKERI